MPPVELVNQSMVSPGPGTADTVITPDPQRALSPGAGGRGAVIVITALTGVRVAEIQPVVLFLDST